MCKYVYAWDITQSCPAEGSFETNVKNEAAVQSGANMGLAINYIEV
jgi:hypothetical protein